MVDVPAGTDPYGMDPRFEAQLIYWCATSPKVWGCLGVHLDWTLLGSDVSKWVVRACREIEVDTGSGPRSTIHVMQRLRRHHLDGKLPKKMLDEVEVSLEEVETSGPIPADAVISEVAPILQHRVRDAMIVGVIEAFAAKRDLAPVLALEGTAAQIGKIDKSVGSGIEPSALDEIAALRAVERHPIGVKLVDAFLGGGLGIGQLGVLIADSGGGKSMGLTQIASESLRRGKNVAYVTLELPVETIKARIISNVLNCPVKSVLEGELRNGAERLSDVSKSLGDVVVTMMPAGITTVQDIQEWVACAESQNQIRYDMILADYGDLIVSKTQKRGSDESSYKSGEQVFLALRRWAHEEQRWIWTACQATRKSRDRTRHIDMHDVADSMHKIRKSSLVLTINTGDSDDLRTVTIFVAKHTQGESRKAFGPFEVGFAYGRLTLTDAPVVVETRSEDSSWPGRNGQPAPNSIQQGIGRVIKFRGPR